MDLLGIKPIYGQGSLQGNVQRSELIAWLNTAVAIHPQMSKQDAGKEDLAVLRQIQPLAESGAHISRRRKETVCPVPEMAHVGHQRPSELRIATMNPSEHSKAFKLAKAFFRHRTYVMAKFYVAQSCSVTFPQARH
jgi:hypothetical protein